MTALHAIIAATDTPEFWRRSTWKRVREPVCAVACFALLILLAVEVMRPDLVWSLIV